MLRPMVESDLSDVLKLNADYVDLLSPLDESELADLRRWATRADVIVSDGQTAGFVLVFSPGTEYGSANYRWFGERYGTQFHYLDRIVIDDGFRRRGLASAVYDEVEGFARARGRLVLEVNIDPPNQPSLEFHRRRGYREVGQLGDPGHRVSLMAKDISDERTSENVT